MDDLGTASTPRGIRNNNPGNLEDNSWTRSLPGYVGTDGRFAKFASPEAGMAALDANLSGYGRKGINTPFSIASTWAPGSEKGNDPGAYGRAIASELGVGPNDKVDLTDPTIRSRIGQAISKVENAGRTAPVGPHGQSLGADLTTASNGASSSPNPLGVSSTPPPQGIQGLQTLAALEQLFPQHQFTPVDYNPFAYMPKVST